MSQFEAIVSADFFELRAPLFEAFGAGFEWAALAKRPAFIMYESFVFSLEWIGSSREFLALRILLPEASIVDFAGQETRKIPNDSEGIQRVIEAVRAYCELHVEARVRELYEN